MTAHPVRSLTLLVWRNLSAHRARSLLTALAIALGVGMTLAAAVVGQAASRQTTQLADEPRVDLEVFARDVAAFDAAALDALRASADVAQASPSLRLEAVAIRPTLLRLTLLGVDPAAYQALHRPELADGAFLPGADTIVLPAEIASPAGLQVGDEIVLAAGDPAALRPDRNAVALTVSGRLKAERDGILSDSAPTAFVPLQVAQALQTRQVGENLPGLEVDRIEVMLRPGVDVNRARARLAQAVGPDLAVVRAVADTGVSGNILLVQAGLAVVGLMVLFAAGFVILNAFAMSVAGRTREIGALRALGMTRRQVMRAVLTEAGLLGAVGAGAGVLIGLGLAWGVMRALGTLKDAPFTAPLWGLALSPLLGLAVTLIAALQPARRASRVPPIVASRPEATASAGRYVRYGGRAGAALLCFLLPGLAAYGLLARPAVFAALAVMVIGQAALLGATVLLLPGLIDPVTALCRPLLTRWLGAPGRLAADNLGRNKLRATLTAGALVAGLTMIVATSGLMTAGLKGGVSRVRSSAHEDGFITGDLAAMVAAQEFTFENFFQFLTQDDLGFELNTAVAALGPLVESGLIEVGRYRFQTIPAGLSALPGAPGLFVDPEIYLSIGNFDFFEGDAETALEWMRRGRAVLLPPIVAERLGVRVGDAIPLQTPHGEATFAVAGVGGGGFLMTVLPYADGEAYFDVSQPSFLGVVVAEGQDVGAALARVQEAIEPFPQIKLHDYDDSLDPVLDIVDRLGLLLNALLLLAVVVAALGVVNTMVINVAERRREIGLLRAVGATQRQVRRAVVAEAATLGLLAALVAGGLGLLMLLTWGILVLPGGTGSLGVRPDWDTIRLTMGAGLRDLGVAAAVSLVFGPLVAALAAYYPARRAAAANVVEATRVERLAL
jgi:putative ABC transport system permease protein